MAVIDWRAKLSEGGVELFDVNDMPVIGSLETMELLEVVSGVDVRFSRVINEGINVSPEVFERLVAAREALPDTTE